MRKYLSKRNSLRTFWARSERRSTMEKPYRH